MASETKFKKTEIGMIPEDWDVGELKDFCSKIGSGATPRGGSNVYVNSGIAFIRSQNVYDEGFKTEGLVFIQDSDAKKLNSVEVKKNDILFNITGDSICRCCIVPDSVLPARVNQHVSIIRTNNKLYYKFLYCYLCLNRTKETLLSFDAGGTRKAITKGNLEKLLLPLPSYIEQTRIGDFIGLINDKIDLNHQMNSTLEQIAQTLFKHWFIDFEFPDENGNPYKSSGGRMVDSELGEIPEGWEVKAFSEVIDVNPIRRLSKGKIATKVSMADLNTWQSWINSWQEEEYKSGPKFKNGDTLFARITPSLENGKTAFVNFLNEGEIAFGSTEFIVFGSKVIESGPYIFCLSRSEYIRETAINAMTGTSGRQRVPNDCFDHLLICVPSGEVVKRFDDIITPLFEKIKNNAKECINLREARDSLLPKLMSGKIRVQV